MARALQSKLNQNSFLHYFFVDDYCSEFRVFSVFSVSVLEICPFRSIREACKKGNWQDHSVNCLKIINNSFEISFSWADLRLFLYQCSEEEILSLNIQAEIYCLVSQIIIAMRSLATFYLSIHLIHLLSLYFSEIWTQFYYESNVFPSSCAVLVTY